MSKYLDAAFRPILWKNGNPGGLNTGFPLHFGAMMDHPKIERISKALADATRLWIFEAISEAGQISCGEIVSMRGVTPATVSHHLKILNEAGLITCRRKGQFVYSEIVPATVMAYTRELTETARRKRRSRRR